MERKHVALLSMALLVIIGTLTGVAYALWSSTDAQGNDSAITMGCFEVVYEEVAGSDISLLNAYPISDAKGLNTVPYEFSIENTCSIASSYAINFEVNSSSTLSAQFLKVAIGAGQGRLLSSLSSTTATLEGRSAYQVTTGILDPGAKLSFAFRMWITEEATQDDAANKSMMGKITVTNVTSFTAPLASSHIASLLADNPTTMNNDDPDSNVRYMGANPNNYVTFNGELWRVIGVFDVASSEGGTTQKRVKLIRNDGIGNYSWDSSDSTVNGGNGVNEWSQADIMMTLNSGAYWNRTSGTCYNSTNNSTIACDFSGSGLTNEAKALINDAYWHTGTVDGVTNTYDNSTTPMMYAGERSTNNGKICSSGTYCNDSVTRTTGWVGKVGLMYPSDYGYATSGGSTTNRETCLTTALYNWDGSGVSDCKNHTWLLNALSYQWTMTPVPYSSYAYRVFRVNTAGYVGNNNANNAGLIRPVVYLSANVKITGGDGTSGNPFILAI